MSNIGKDPDWVCACGKTAMRGLESARCGWCGDATRRDWTGKLFRTSIGKIGAEVLRTVRHG